MKWLQPQDFDRKYQFPKGEESHMLVLVLHKNETYEILTVTKWSTTDAFVFGALFENSGFNPYDFQKLAVIEYYILNKN